MNLIDPERVLPEWLRLGGYHTVHVGKWASVPGEIPPEGWSEWYGIAQETSARYYGFELVGTGEPLAFGEEDGDYHTDAVTQTAVEAIERHAGRPRPLFLSVAYLAPHVGLGRADAATERCNPGGTAIAPVPAARHAGAFEDARLPMPPSFDEPDVSDKTGDQPGPVNAREAEELLLHYRCRLAALQAVDEGVADLVEALDDAGELDETYFFYTSDNGFLLGEHRYDARKNLPYEEAATVPLLFGGPVSRPAGTVGEPAANVDLASTILELTGVEPPSELERPQDGRSLVPLLAGDGGWPERAILLEGRDDTSEEGDTYEVESYRAVHTARYALIRKYVEEVDSFEAGAEAGFGGGELVGTELYDLDRDPYELESVAGDPAYAEIETLWVMRSTRLPTARGRRASWRSGFPSLPDDVARRIVPGSITRVFTPRSRSSRPTLELTNLSASRRSAARTCRSRGAGRPSPRAPRHRSQAGIRSGDCPG